MSDSPSIPNTHGNSVRSQSWNAEFDFWKFVACLSILLVHSHSFYGYERIVFRNGHFAVELFFMLTGFFFARSVARDTRPFSRKTIGLETWQFIWRKTKTFLPYYLFGYACSVIVAMIRYPLGRLVRMILPGLPLDILLLGEVGIPVPYIQVINWYLSSMLVVLFLFYPLFRWTKELFSDWFAPIVSLLLLGIQFTTYGTSAPHVTDRVALLPACLFRAGGGILLGVFASRVAVWLEHETLSMSTCFRKGLSLAGTCAPIVAFTLIGTTKSDRISPTLIFLFFVFVCLCGAGLSLLRPRLPLSICRWLARFGLALFLTHTPVRFALLRLSYRFPALAHLFAGRSTLAIAGTLTVYLTASAVIAIVCMVACAPWVGCANKK